MGLKYATRIFNFCPRLPHTFVACIYMYMYISMAWYTYWLCVSLLNDSVIAWLLLFVYLHVCLYTDDAALADEMDSEVDSALLRYVCVCVCVYFVISLDYTYWVLYVVAVCQLHTHHTLTHHTPHTTHSDPDYKEYKSSTPPLLPGISSLYHKTPYCLKLIFCCEFPFYHSKPEAPPPSWEETSVWDRGSDAISTQPRSSITSSGHSGVLYTPTYTSSRNIF